ncbi:MAG: hypothetical protein EPN93_15380 [Spirochaetes bacterium]|nr:MAG: hypothetical protein EPN93_15380 [Spirochaetota bacterium]
MASAQSDAVNILVSIIPIVGIVMGSVVLFFYLMWWHKQRMFLIQKDIVQKKNFDLESFSLLAGLMLLGIGGSLTLFFLLKEGLSYSVLSGIIPLSTGLSLFAFFIIKKNLRSNEKGS